MLQNSPMALRCPQAALNADCDRQGCEELAGNATMLFYMTEEGQEGRSAFNQKRQPDFNANSNGIRVRSAQVYLADPHGRGGGSARQAVKNPRRAVCLPA